MQKIEDRAYVGPCLIHPFHILQESDIAVISSGLPVGWSLTRERDYEGNITVILAGHGEEEPTFGIGRDESGFQLIEVSSDESTCITSTYEYLSSVMAALVFRLNNISVLNEPLQKTA